MYRQRLIYILVGCVFCCTLWCHVVQAEESPTSRTMTYRPPVSSGSSTGGGDFANGGDAATANRTLGNTTAYSVGFLTDHLVRLLLQASGEVRFLNQYDQEDYLEFSGVNADGRMQLKIHDGTLAQAYKIFQAKENRLVIGPGSAISPGYAISGNIAFYGENTVLGAPVFGKYAFTTGTHKSAAVGTPDVTAGGQTGFGGHTDVVDLATFSTVSNTWSGTRPGFTFTALQHVFNTDDSAGYGNPGTTKLTIADTAVTLNTTLAQAMGTIAVDATTPDVAGYQILVTSANTQATEITDLTNPVVGSILYLVGGSDTNPSTITDGGNFTLSAGWTANNGNVLTLLVREDNDYLEVSRSTNN